MIFNAHSHIFHKNSKSEFYTDAIIDWFSKSANMPKELFMQIPDIDKQLNPDAEYLVKAMDASGFDKGLVMLVDFELSIAGEAKWSVEEMNQWAANQVAKYPDRLYALCAVDPRRGDRAIELIEKAVEEWGMKGVKLYPTCGFYPDDPQFFPFYKRCEELDIGIFSHTTIATMPLMESKYADPIYLDSVATKFPDLKIVLIHLGIRSWTMKCIEMMSKNPNVYADISGWQSIAFYETEQYLRMLHEIFETNSYGFLPIKHKIMFGTDWPAFEGYFNGKDWADWIKNIPEKAKEYDLKFKQSDIDNLLGLNAKKLLDI